MFFTSLALDFDTVAIRVVGQAVFVCIHIQRLRGFDLRQKLGFRVRDRVAVAVRTEWCVATVNSFVVGLVQNVGMLETRSRGNAGKALPRAAPPFDNRIGGVELVTLVEFSDLFLW